MKIGKGSCVPLVLGLILSLLGVWAGAAPVLGNGASVLGGLWYAHEDPSGWYGCTSSDGGACGAGSSI